MTPEQLLHILQYSDSFFPVGSFAYSDGLETATSSQEITDGKGLEEWMEHFVETTFLQCDGPALLQTMTALEIGDIERVQQLDREVLALKPAASARAATCAIGKRLLVAASDITNASFAELPHGTAPVAYGVAFFHRGMKPDHGLLAYGYARLAGIVSAGLRLISMGQTEGQQRLTRVLGRLPAAVGAIFERKDEPLRAFSPLLDIQQMNHRYVYSRLFRS